MKRLAPGRARADRLGIARTGADPHRGGLLNLRLREDLPQGFAIHESPTISTMWPAMPCLSNLVLFDPLKTTHTAESVIGELAEKWSWQDSYRNLVFFLRADVKWHDGRPFTARGRDVHLRHAPRGARTPREAPAQSAARLVGQRRGFGRRHRSADGDLPAEAAAALAAPDARLRLHADLRRARPRRRAIAPAASAPGPSS